MKLLQPLEANECPFKPRPKTNERPHWARPELVAQIKFTEWTADGKLRHPVYLGLRDDKKPQDVHREEKSRVTATSTRRLDDTAVGGLVVSDAIHYASVLIIEDVAQIYPALNLP